MVIPSRASCDMAATAPSRCSQTMRCTRSATALSCSAGVMPAGSRRRTPSARALIRPATRTRKNSSRFELTMARNLIRSISGTSSARPWRSTRSLNSSQLNSRLRYMSCDRKGSLDICGCFTSAPGGLSFHKCLRNKSDLAWTARCSNSRSVTFGTQTIRSSPCRSKRKFPGALDVAAGERVGHPQDRR